MSQTSTAGERIKSHPRMSILDRNSLVWKATVFTSSWEIIFNFLCDSKMRVGRRKKRS
jgi:hypothetical protein